MDLRLSSQVALVTGASKGIGLAIARTLLEEGAQVAAVSRTRSPELEALAGPSLLHVPADLSDPSAPAAAVEAAVEAFGGLDILVNNAGGPPPGVRLPRFTFLAPTDEDWRDMFDFNLFSAVRAIRAAIPHLLARGGGSIVNVSSTMGRQPAAVNVDYGAAKAALAHVTKSLSEEYGSQGIRVNTVAPGATVTAWWTEEGGAADIFASASDSTREEVLSSGAAEAMGLVTGRLVEPQEIADVVALLVSPRSASTTGAEFVVDGGQLKEL
jgi:NAD(P)-dependent dehydrogenase (short-subunit alcohol dehydrogenase family)